MSNKRIYDEEQYSLNNPPSSVEVAQERLLVLEMDIPQIETDLGHLRSTNFSNDEEFVDWRRRATHALGWKKSERRFLLLWIRAVEKQIGKEQRRTEYDRVSAAIKDVEAGWIKKINFTPKITEANLPQTFPDIESRRIELFESRKWIPRAIREMRDISHDVAGRATRAFHESRRRIKDIDSKIEKEYQLLSKARKILLASGVDRLKAECPDKTRVEIGVEIEEIKRKLKVKRVSDGTRLVLGIIRENIPFEKLRESERENIELVERWLNLLALQEVPLEQ